MVNTQISLKVFLELATGVPQEYLLDDIVFTCFHDATMDFSGFYSEKPAFCKPLALLYLSSFMHLYQNLGAAAINFSFNCQLIASLIVTFLDLFAPIDCGASMCTIVLQFLGVSIKNSP